MIQKLVLFIIILASTLTVRAELFAPGDWTRRFNSASYFGVAVGADLTVAVGASGSIVTSPNGLTHWTCIDTGMNKLFYDVLWDGDRFFAVGQDGILFISGDGVSWSQQSLNTTDNLQAIDWNGSVYVVAGENGRIFTSGDGVSWTQSDTGYEFTVFDLIADNGSFLASGDNGGILTSPNGITWTRQTLDSSAPFGHIYKTATGYLVYANYVVIYPVGPSQVVTEIYESTDGVTWVESEHDPTETHPDALWTGSVWIALDANHLTTSDDGVVWTREPPKPDFESIASNDHLFVAVGDPSAIYISDDGVRWTRTFESETSSEISDVVWNGDKFMAVGEDGLAYTSATGHDWTVQEVFNPQAQLYRLTWNDVLWVAVGELNGVGVVYTSADGEAWTQQTISGASRLGGVAWNGTRFVAVGFPSAIYYSGNGTIWTAASSSADQALYQVAWNGSHFAAVGVGGVIYLSQNGVSWWERETAAPFLFDVVGGSWGFLAVGAYGQVVYSANGSKWISLENGLDEHMHAVTFNGDTFAMISNVGKIFTAESVALDVAR